MLEIVKVQRPIGTNDPDAPDADRKHTTQVPGAVVPNHVKIAMGSYFKAYFLGA